MRPLVRSRRLHDLESWNSPFLGDRHQRPGKVWLLDELTRHGEEKVRERLDALVYEIFPVLRGVSSLQKLSRCDEAVCESYLSVVSFRRR